MGTMLLWVIRLRDLKTHRRTAFGITVWRAPFWFSGDASVTGEASTIALCGSPKVVSQSNPWAFFWDCWGWSTWAVSKAYPSTGGVFSCRSWECSLSSDCRYHRCSQSPITILWTILLVQILCDTLQAISRGRLWVACLAMSTYTSRSAQRSIVIWRSVNLVRSTTFLHLLIPFCHSSAT